MKIIFGINPVMELIKGKNRNIENILITNSILKRKVIQNIIVQCKEMGIPYKIVSREYLDRITNRKKHQNIAAIIGNIEYVPYAYAFNYKRIVFLDRITDCGNLGAILRSCAYFGWEFILLPNKESAPINEYVFKASAGGIEYLKISRIKSSLKVIQRFKTNDFVIIGADIRGKQIQNINLNGYNKILLIMGSEGKGIRKSLLRICDKLLYIPGNGNIDSLNVSVASGIMLYSLNNILKG